jgi:hypothetical protein
LNEPTSETAFVRVQQSRMFVGATMVSPAVIVGAVADATGTLTTSQTFSVTGQAGHPQPH